MASAVSDYFGTSGDSSVLRSGLQTTERQGVEEMKAGSVSNCQGDAGASVIHGAANAARVIQWSPSRH